MDMQQAQAIVVLDESLKMAPDVLGAEVSATLNVTDGVCPERMVVTIRFPADAKDSAGKLTPPPLCFPMLSDGRQWGIRHQTYIMLSSLLMTTDLPAEGADVSASFYAFEDSCVLWVRQLIDWISVLTGQLVGTRHRPALPPVDAYQVDAALIRGMEIVRLPRVTLDRDRPKKQEPAHLVHLEHALGHLSRGEETSLPHRLLLGAHTELYRGAYDRAVINAYVAVETALARATDSNPGEVRSLLKPTRWKNLLRTWPELPARTDMQESLIGVRDNVAHTGLRPASATQAWSAYFLGQQVVAVLSAKTPCSTSPPGVFCPGGDSPSS